MATLYVAEFSKLYTNPNGVGQMGQCPPLAEQTVAIGGGSLQTSAFNAVTTAVRVHADAICSIAFGADPTASTTTMRMAAGQTEYFGVTGGTKVAVITNS